MLHAIAPSIAQRNAKGNRAASIDKARQSGTKSCKRSVVTFGRNQLASPIFRRLNVRNDQSINSDLAGAACGWRLREIEALHRLILQVFTELSDDIETVALWPNIAEESFSPALKDNGPADR